jgi:Family of unknown function (DUF6498)
MPPGLTPPAQAPSWLARLATPFIARQVARQLAKDNPGGDPAQIAAKMRADLGEAPDPRALAMVDAVERYLPPRDGPARADPGRASALALVAANLAPLYGVLALGWDTFPLVLLFWLENVVIGLLNAARMLCADPRDPATWAGKLFMLPFFCFHYGMFTAIHGVFVFSLFGGKSYGEIHGLWTLDAAARAVRELDLGFALLALAASHLFSFLWNYLGQGEFRRASLGALMAQPYGRVVVLHLAIIGGGFAAMALGSPVWALLLLIALKVGFDLRAHLKEHRETPA